MGGTPQRRRRVAAATVPDLGLHRVSWVRIVLAPAGARCDVAGVAHRRPVVRPVPLRTATALMAAGVPAVVRSAPGAATPRTPAVAASPALGDQR